MSFLSFYLNVFVRSTYTVLFISARPPSRPPSLPPALPPYLIADHGVAAHRLEGTHGRRDAAGHDALGREGGREEGEEEV